MGRWQRLARRWQELKVILGFLLVVCVLWMAVPRGKRFYYEFQEGKEWVYPTLLAPYDYPLYKTNSEYRREKEKILQGVQPIFQNDTTVVQRVIPQVLNEIREYYLRSRDSVLLNHRRCEEGIRPPGEEKEVRLGQDTIYRGTVEDILRYLYRVGVVQSAKVLQESPSTAFSIMRNGVAYPTILEEVYTPRTANAFLRHTLRRKQSTAWIADYLPRMDLIGMLEPNILFDSTLSSLMQKDRLSQLSATKGLVLSGEKIVGQGSVISRECYQKLVSLRREMQSRARRGVWAFATEIGYFLLILMVFTLYYVFIRTCYPTLFERANYRKVLFLTLTSGLFVLTGFLVLNFRPSGLYIIPLAIVPLLVRVFFDARMAFVTYLLITLLIAFFAMDSFSYATIMLMAGSVAVMMVKTSYRRGHLFKLVLLVLLAYILTYSTITIIQEGNWKSFNLATVGFLGLNALLTLATYQLMAPIERIFGFISNTTLMELCDSNQPLLRELAEKAPGTFQHSMQVASLAEEATAKVGGNSLLARTGALYHDIGKINHPEYFTENQIHGMSPHDNLGYKESAKIIIRHVTDGVEMARKYRIPEQIIDFIRTHHGNSQAKYFYIKYKESHENGEADVEDFTYPGPRPFSKEMAILMMADSVEAASRSMEEVNRETLLELINKIINGQQKNGQFNTSDITFKEVDEIKGIFLRKLENVYHSRIAYPEEKKKEKASSETRS